MKFSTILITVCCLVLSVACNNNKQKELAICTINELKALAEQGDAEAQYELGCRYGIGIVVTQDYAEAVKWYRKAAEQGHADAQFNLGVRYYKGEGVTKDDAEAVRWLRKAAEQGHAEAKIKLNDMGVVW